ncbi:MAG: anhydro-N-acetylmuramic acid kinase [Pseudomonadota bacterium]|nr:anhydro-N-acetylmuramic acid kinase [Pseudomonadota bacterium]
MSGTSMDGVDAALVDFAGPTPRLAVRHAHPMPEPLRAALLALAQPGDNELDRLARLDSAVARLFAGAVHQLLNTAGIPPGRVRAIGSHGQTVRHRPAGPEPYTVQIGNPSLLAELTGITTVADFRRRDMAAGGQGAPLAPAFHAAFFHQPGETRVVVNIGGMANVTLLPARAGHPVTGFDTGPGNALLDAWSQRHQGQPLDLEGRWGQSGNVLPELLEMCLQDDYFSRPPPKSTGRERFNLDWLTARLAEQGKTCPPQDVQATLAALTARSIALAIRRHAPEAARLLVCGGGVHNRAVMAGLRRELPALAVDSTAAWGVDPDFLEAMGFAWLARRTLDGLPGNLPEVTGARGARILGGIYPA